VLESVSVGKCSGAGAAGVRTYSEKSVYTESGLKLLGLDLASLAMQGVGAEAQPNAYTGYGIICSTTDYQSDY